MSNIYTPDQSEISAAFCAAATTYDASAIIEQEVSLRLLDKLAHIPIQPTQILDLGCGTGRDSVVLKSIFPNANVIGLDLAFDMVNYARSNLEDYVCANALALPFANQQFDLIYTNCCLPYIYNIKDFLFEAHRVLRINGMLLCSSLGPSTFAELNIQNNLHLDMHILGDLLQTTFNDPVLDADQLTFTYPDGQLLIDDLKGSGHIIDFNSIKLDQTHSITVEAIYALAWKLHTKQHTDNDGKVYVNIDHIEYL